jgi:hypothetical protein
LFGKLKEKITNKGNEIQGKISSWMEAGFDHENLLWELHDVISTLQNDSVETFGIKPSEVNMLTNTKDHLTKVNIIINATY